MNMIGTIVKVSAVALGIAFVASASSGAIAGNWAQNHPRREQVNDRLQNQNKRINNELKEGDITQRQANQLHREDRQIRQEERDMARQNGGHITKLEQGTLNQQENHVSGPIGK
jgi:Skp family chaperone for outer membrane proteins